MLCPLLDSIPIHIVKHSAMFQYYVLLCLAGLVHSEVNDYRKLQHTEYRTYPLIGRLFRADVSIPDNPPKINKEVSDYIIKINKPTSNEESLNDEIRSVKKDVTVGSFNEFSTITGINSANQQYISAEYGNVGPRRRYKRSKGIILSGTKFETDYREDKNKKHEYEFKKKSSFRGNVKQKRTKRSEDYAKEKLENENRNSSSANVQSVKENNGSSIAKSTNDYSKINRKEYAQKLFQRKVEALFNIEADNDSTLSDEEIEKSKMLRKQLLNFYVKGKQKNTLTSLHNRSVQDENKEIFTSQNKEAKMLPSYLHLNIDIPVDDIEDLLEVDKIEDSETTIEGRGRRRRILRRIIIPILLALKLKLAIFLPIIFGLVTLIAFKGLWAGITSLGVVSALALKSLINGQKVFYEIRAPHHFHYPPTIGHEIQYHHGFPEYWSRREDSYKPMGGWSNIGQVISKMDHEISASDNDSEYADQDTKPRTNKPIDKASLDCKKSREERKS